MTCYKVIGGELAPTEDPTDIDGVEDYGEALTLSGYRVLLDSDIEEVDFSASVTVYVTDNTAKPRFFLDLWGHDTQIATLVAADFPNLVSTLRHIAPLLQLIRLDQYASYKENLAE